VKIADNVLGPLGASGDVDGKKSDEVETMVVTPRSFASCNGEAIRLELTVRHG
jgi:hypothetical protein